MSTCEYCDGERTVETDNNGPIVDCPVCELSEPKAGSTDLLPCPFCGSQNVGMYKTDPDKPFLDDFVFCNDCDACGPEGVRATELWNSAAR